MGGLYEVNDIKICYDLTKENMSLWKMLDYVCFNYSTENCWTRMVYIADLDIFNDFKTKLLSNDLYANIKPKIKSAREYEESKTKNYEYNSDNDY